MSSSAESGLAQILQLAYSGELAAAYAYRGHWKSSLRKEDRERIREIEEEEWDHRRLVGEMLATLGQKISPLRELRAHCIGRTLGALCWITGWLAPMIGAGALERRNVFEYITAAEFARDSGHEEWIDCLLEMAEVEWEHEAYFRGGVDRHWLGRHLPLWERPGQKADIRAQFGHSGPELRTQS